MKLLNAKEKKVKGVAVLMALSLCSGMFSFAVCETKADAAEYISEQNESEVQESDSNQSESDKNVVFDAQNQDDEYTVTVNDKGFFTIENYEESDNSVESIKWSVSDESIMQVTDSSDFAAKYEALSAGRVDVYADVTFKSEKDISDSDEYYDDESTYWERLSFSVCVYPDMSNVEIINSSQTKYITSSDYGAQFEFELKSDILIDQNDPDAGFSYKSSNSSMDVSAALNNNILTVSAYEAGQTDIVFTVYGASFTVKIKVVKIGINKNTLLMVKGKSAQIKVKGVSKGIKWKSTKSSVAKVNGSGKIKASKLGNTVIVANVNGTKVGCAVSVVSPKIYNVIKRAKSIAKGKYSQAKRMQKGYFDCSSLVWRSYSKYGIYFGVKNYAPVAADICKWCCTKGKKVSNKLTYAQIQNMKLSSGDLIFKTGAKNGRYKGVYHVEMFTGYVCNGFTEKGKPILNTVWANRTEGYYALGSVVGRP